MSDRAIVLTDAPEPKAVPKMTRCPQHPSADRVVVNMAEDMACSKCGRALEREA